MASHIDTARSIQRGVRDLEIDPNVALADGPADVAEKRPRSLDVLEHVAAKNEIKMAVELVGAEILGNDLDPWPLRVGRILAGHGGIEADRRPRTMLHQHVEHMAVAAPDLDDVLADKVVASHKPCGQVLREGLELRREVQRILVSGRIDHPLRLKGAVPDQRAGPAGYQIHVARGCRLRRFDIGPKLIADHRHVAEQKDLCHARSAAERTNRYGHTATSSGLSPIPSSCVRISGK